MRICFSLTNLELGGAQVFVCRLANQLSAKGHKMFIYDHWPEYRDKGMVNMISPEVTLLSYCESSLLRGAIWKINAVLKIVGISSNYRHTLNQKNFFRQMKKHRVEVVNSHMLFSDDVVSGSQDDLPFRLVVTFHGEYEMFMDAGVTKPVERTMENVIRKASALIVTADKNFRVLPAYHSERLLIRRINVGLDPGAFTRKTITKKSQGFNENDFVVGMVSRGIPEKGWDTCMEVISRYNSSADRKVKLLMIGNGPYLKEYVEKNGTPDMKLVQFNSDMQDYFSYYQIFDVMLFPTRFPGESFPNVVIESLYWGIPVIASRIGAIEQMIGSEQGEAAGICVDIKSENPIEDLVHALTLLVNDSMLRSKMSQNAKKAFEKFNIADVAEQYLRVFDEVSCSIR